MKQNSERTRGSSCGVLHAVSADPGPAVIVRLCPGSDCCDAQRSDGTVRAHKRTVRAHFHMGTWSRRADKQREAAKCETSKLSQRVWEGECVELHLQPQQPHPSSLDPHTSSPQLSRSSLSQHPPTHAHTHHHPTKHPDRHTPSFLHQPNPSTPNPAWTHIHLHAPCQSETGMSRSHSLFWRERKGKNGRKSVHQSLYHSEPSLRVVAQRGKRKKECEEGNWEGDMDEKK